MHRHIVKVEDIINRGGAALALRMFASDSDGNIDRAADVVVATDGIKRHLKLRLDLMTKQQSLLRGVAICDMDELTPVFQLADTQLA